MLQGFSQLYVPFLQFFERPNILDRDHGLVGKGLQKSYLLVGEMIDCGTTNENRSNRNTFAHQWYSKLGSVSFIHAGLWDLRKFSRSYRRQILNVDGLTLDNGSAGY